MDVQKTIEFILEHESRTEVRLEEITIQIQKLAAAQAETDRKLGRVANLVAVGIPRVARLERNLERLERNVERLGQNVDRLVAGLLVWCPV